jgi:hypothetical protein
VVERSGALVVGIAAIHMDRNERTRRLDGSALIRDTTGHQPGGHRVDASSEIEIIRLLDSGESLLWTGTPRRGLLLRLSDVFLIPFSLLWCGFALFWEVSVIRSDAPIFFRLWGIPFVLAGLYIVAGRFFADARLRARTHYGLTSRRVVIASGLFSRTITSLPLATLNEVTLQERADRSGTILLGRPDPRGAWFSGMQWPGIAHYQTPSFELIPDVKRVYDRVLEAQRAERVAS